MSPTSLGWTFMIAGASVLVPGVIAVWRAQASTQWPEVEGEVLESTVKEGRASRGGVRFSPSVLYAYQVGGATYQGTRIAFAADGLARRSRGQLERFLQQLPKGTHIPVRVSPDDPSLSVLAPGADRSLKLLLFIGPYLMFVGLGCLLGWWS